MNSFRPIPALLIPGLLAAVTLWLGGCASPPPTVETYRTQQLDYPHTPAPARSGAVAVVTAVHRLTPARIEERLRQGHADTEIYCQAIAETEVADLADSGLFARVLTAPAPEADYAVRLESDQAQGPDYKFTVTCEITDLHENRLLGRRSFTVTSAENLPMKDDVAKAMNLVKQALAAELVRRQQEAAAREAETALARLPLAGLIAATDDTVPLIQARNHALITAKTRQLPDLLRSAGTETLTALIVQIEQTMLDLNHAAEIAKDRAQQALANGEGDAAEEQRERSLGCHERIELLKPIAAAIKEEIANRSR